MVNSDSLAQSKLTSEQDTFTNDKKRRYRDTTKQITSQLQGALILHRLKTGNKGKPDVAQLSYDQNRSIIEHKSKDTQQKGAVDILGHIEDINILNIKKKLYQIINASNDIENDDKDKLKTSITTFIRNQFFTPRYNIEKKKRLPHKKFRRFYSRLASEQTDLNEKSQTLYKDICISFANLLFEKDNNSFHKSGEHTNYNLVNENGQITDKGLQHIGLVFLIAIKNIPNSGDPKSFHQIFHDGDFNFLRREDSAGNPIIGTLDHYVRAIMYLMDYDGFNAYAEGGDNGTNERYIAKKALLNGLYNAFQLETNDHQQRRSDKGIIHKKLYEEWGSHKDDVTIPTDRELTARLKTEASKLLKISGRTPDIKDESGLRATYYGNGEDHNVIIQSIIKLISNFLSNVKDIDGMYIQNITSARKGNFISVEDEDKILNHLVDNIGFSYNDEIPDISKRQKSSSKQSKLESICTKYKALCKQKASPGLQQAYKIASGEITRGSNGNYEDFKLIIEYFIKKDEFNEGNEDSRDNIDNNTTLYQEISFYPHDNDLNMGNHGILDLEKKIFTRIRTVNVPGIGKSISLHRLRYYTETAIKDISFEIDQYEYKIKKGLLPKPKNDGYQYLCIDDERISLKGLINRNQENTDRFDDLILMILNYFIIHNKIFYINKKDDRYHGLITKTQLHNKKDYKTRRFTSSDQLRNIALDAENKDHNIALYTSNDTKRYNHFYMVNLGDLGDFIELEK